MKKLMILGIFAAVLSACSATGTTPTPPSSPTSQSDTSMMTASPSPAAMMEKAPTTKTITLDAQNASGQSGTAVVAATKDGKVMVTLTLKGGKFTAPQPAHIHLGSCPTPAAVVYPLTNVVNGKSVTTLNATMDQIWQAGGSLAINVHKSATEISSYTACGNLK